MIGQAVADHTIVDFNWNNHPGGRAGQVRRAGVVVTGIWRHDVDSEIVPVPKEEVDLLKGCDEVIRSILGRAYCTLTETLVRAV